MGIEGLFAPSHLLILLVIVALVFGTKKLRSAGGDIGAAVKSFRKAMHEDEPVSPAEHASPPPLEAKADDGTASVQARREGNANRKESR